MRCEHKHILTLRLVSVGFIVAALGVFRPFGLGAFSGTLCLHLLLLWLLGVGVCFLTEAVVTYVVGIPQCDIHDTDCIIRRNRWFQLINTPLEALMICLYRHCLLGDVFPANVLSWGSYCETLIITAFCSFAVGIYWRYRLRGHQMAGELGELKRLNSLLQAMQQAATQGDGGNNPSQSTSVVTIKGSTSESITIDVGNLLYVESVGNYVNIHYLRDGNVHTDMLRATSRQIEEALQGCPTIVRCHRAFLVNLRRVERIVGKAGGMSLVVGSDAREVPVSRSNKKMITETLGGLRCAK